MTKAVMIVVLVVFGVGYGCGARHASQPEVVTKTVTVRVPYTRIEVKEVVKPAPLPESCRLVASLTKEAFMLDGTISKESASIKSALGEGAKQIATGDIVKWNAAIQLTIDAKRNLDRALVTKAGLVTLIQSHLVACDKALTAPE